jgi:electron transfer flavoprotein beta subunit
MENPKHAGIMSARTKPLKVSSQRHADSGVKLQKFELPPPKGSVKMISADNVTELVNSAKKRGESYLRGDNIVNC